MLHLLHVYVLVTVDQINAEESFLVDDWVIVDSIPTPPPPEAVPSNQTNQEQSSVFPEALDTPLNNDTHEEAIFNDDKYVNLN